MTKDEFKIRWIEALRSEKYEQNNGSLKAGDAYCCLGVAADIIDPSLWEKYARNELRSSWMECSNFLPQQIWSEFGDEDIDQGILSSMNDMGLSFKVIANHIERHLHTNIPVPVLERDEFSPMAIYEDIDDIPIERLSL